MDRLICVDRHFEAFKDVGATLFPDGTVYWAYPLISYTSCLIDARLFPFDTQYCKFRFGSWAYDLNQLDLVVGSKSQASAEKYFIENGIWHMNDFLVERVLTDYGEAGVFPEVVFTIVLKRHHIFYVLSFVLPCGLLSALNLLVFLLPTESGEKVSFGITNLLALVLFQQMIGNVLPPSSKYMPFLIYYFTPMIFISCIAILSAVIVAALYQQDKAKPVPRFLRRIFNVSPTTANVSKSPAKYNRRPSDIKYPTKYKNVSESNFPAKYRKVSEELANNKSNTMVKANGHVTVNVKKKPRSINESYDKECYADELTRMMDSSDNEVQTVFDYSDEWRQLAINIDKRLLVTCIVLTAVALIMTIVLYVR